MELPCAATSLRAYALVKPLTLRCRWRSRFQPRDAPLHSASKHTLCVCLSEALLLCSADSSAAHEGVRRSWHLCLQRASADGPAEPATLLSANAQAVRTFCASS